MNRPQLFSRTLAIMFRSGSFWLVALSVTVVNVIINLGVPGSTLVEVTGKMLLGLVMGAFLTGALISLMNAIAEGQAVSASDGFTAGARTFLPLLLVGVILAIPTWLLSQVLSGVFTPLASVYQVQLNSADPNAVSSTMAQASVLLCCLLPLVLVALLLVALVVGALGVGAERAIVLEGQSVWAALKRGGGLLLSRFSDFLVIGLIMLAIVAGIAILFICPASVIIYITSGLAGAFSDVARWMANYSVILTLVFAILGIPIGILFSGVWTLAFRRWQGKDAAAVVQPPVQPLPLDFPGPPAFPGT